jgi:hypothetical protein
VIFERLFPDWNALYAWKDLSPTYNVAESFKVEVSWVRFFGTQVAISTISPTWNSGGYVYNLLSPQYQVSNAVYVNFSPSWLILYPIIVTVTADDTDGNWLPSTPAADLYSMIDESTPSDSDHDYTDSASTMRLKLGTVSPKRIRYRIRSHQSKTIKVRLMEGTTQLHEWTHTNVPFIWTEYLQEVTASVTNTNNLFLEVQSV